MFGSTASGVFSFDDALNTRGLASRFRLNSLLPEDEAAIVGIIERTLLRFREQGQILASTHRRLSRFYQSYKEEGSSYMILKDNLTSAIIGGVGVRPFAGLDPQEGHGEIRELVIDAAFRGLGLGRSLMAAATRRAALIGYTRLYLEATSEMQHAQTLFRRCGFRPLALPQGAEGDKFPSYFIKEG